MSIIDYNFKNILTDDSGNVSARVNIYRGELGRVQDLDGNWSTQIINRTKLAERDMSVGPDQDLDFLKQQIDDTQLTPIAAGLGAEPLTTSMSDSIASGAMTFEQVLPNQAVAPDENETTPPAGPYDFVGQTCSSVTACRAECRNRFEARSAGRRACIDYVNNYQF